MAHRQQPHRAATAMACTLAAFLILVAAGMVAFWTRWFASGDYQSAGTECYRIFENSFPLPDSVLAIFSVATAVCLFRRHRHALWLGAFIAGMYLYLAALDAWYHLQHRAADPYLQEQTAGAVVIVVVCTLAGLALPIHLGRHGPGLFPSEYRQASPNRRPTACTIVIGILGVYMLLTAGYWFASFTGRPHDFADCTQVFHHAFFLADMSTLLTAVIALHGVFRGRPWGLLAGLMTTGGVTFGTLNYTAFTLLNTARIGAAWPAYTALIFLAFTLAGATAALLYRHRPWLLGQRPGNTK